MGHDPIAAVQGERDGRIAPTGVGFIGSRAEVRDMTLLERAGTAAGLVVVAGLVAAGLWGVLDGVLGGGYLAATVAAGSVVAGLVFSLFVLGARSDRWLENPYW